MKLIGSNLKDSKNIQSESGIDTIKPGTQSNDLQSTQLVKGYLTADDED